MSNYNWAKGSIKIPAKFYPKVRDALVRFETERQTDLYQKAIKVYTVVKAMKFKRGTDKHALVSDEDLANDTLGSRNAINAAFGYNFDPEDRETIARSIFPRQKDADGKAIWGKHVTRAQKPKKKDFPIANKATKRFKSDDLIITLDPKTKTVHFNGDENNRAQERALECDLAGALFDALSRVEWTARTGGKILGNDEYNREEGGEYEGGGGSYVLHSWGKGQKSTRRRTRRSSFASVSGNFGYYGSF